MQWRGGKREPYPNPSKKDSSQKSKAHKKAQSPKKKRSSSNVDKEKVDDNGWWTCQCGDKIASTKSRCGNCHHWRGGKRKGGWKIKSFGKSGVDDGIDWSQEWTCCDKVISAKKKRCGTCHGWRGGRRCASTKTSSSSDSKANLPNWTCSQCSTINPGSQKRCGSCNTSKKKGSLGAALAKASKEDSDDNAKYSVTEFI